jgi:hypothetical protein
MRALGRCPYCVWQWIAAGFAVGLAAAPQLTRLIGGIYVAETIADGLPLAYNAPRMHDA